MYALFVLPVHVYYVNCNAKTHMGYLCALIKLKKNIMEFQTMAKLRQEPSKLICLLNNNYNISVVVKNGFFSRARSKAFLQ